MKTCAHKDCDLAATWRVGQVITCNTHLGNATKRWPRAQVVELPTPEPATTGDDQ